ncbi:MAG: 1,6-anhydro-N-acetylmuramyl-L-alanine amidase AmpD [Gammaproteobacteria bacterium]|nr:1,6-anhydro-N-acetylmuramyl-L-alanine amidase AmpD [Gammaproteobacteria bacterium]
MNIEHGGWLTNVRRNPSPNCDERPAGIDIDLAVIHCISLPPGEFGGPFIDALFTNTLDEDAHPAFKSIAGLRVSAHILIRRDGAQVQYVPFQKRAWHAGRSYFAGRTACNDFSIGIELEGAENIAYTQVQYQVLAELIRVLMVAWPGITPARLAGHSDIAPGRKTDPGPMFDWELLHALLSSRLNASSLFDLSL